MQLEQDSAGHSRLGTLSQGEKGEPLKDSKQRKQYSFITTLTAALWLSIFSKVQALHSATPELQTSGHFDVEFSNLLSGLSS